MPRPKDVESQKVPAKPASQPPSRETEGEKPKPDKWWKWVLLYPTLAISVISAVPTYIEFVGSNLLDVPFGEYREAKRENELWQENINCAAAPFDGLKNKHNVEVDAVVCQSGNVLVRVKPPDNKTKYRWVPLETPAQQRTAASLISTAHARSLRVVGEIAQGNFVVICQQWLGNGMIRRRIQDINGRRCFDEVVNTFNGQVVSTTAAPCIAC
jgi:hypothetical protein